MIDDLKTIDLSDLKTIPGFAPVDETKLPNAALRLAEGRRFERLTTERTTAVLNKGRAAAAQLERLPPPGGSIHCVLRGSYALGDLIPAVLSLGGAPIDALKIATLGFSRRNAEDLAALLADGMIGRLDILASHYFASADSVIWDHAAAVLSPFPDVRLLAMRTHAKLLLIEQAGTFYTVESSANLRSCVNIEQATIINDPGLYAFHAEWMNELFAQGENHHAPRKNPTPDGPQETDRHLPKRRRRRAQA